MAPGCLAGSQAWDGVVEAASGLAVGLIRINACEEGEIVNVDGAELDELCPAKGAVLGPTFKFENTSYNGRTQQ